MVATCPRHPASSSVDALLAKLRVPAFPADCTTVSVEGDATFCSKGLVCSGSCASPAGTKCPKVGDYAIDDCYDYLKSGKSNSTFCIVPVDASCKKIKTGAWGCVWNVPDAAVLTKISLAAGGTASATTNSVSVTTGYVAAALAVAGAAFAAVVNQRKQRQVRGQHQKVAEGQFISMTQSPAVVRG